MKHCRIIELKFDGSPHSAISQINEKEYALKYAKDHRRIIKIGASFSSKTKRLSGWLIE